MAAAQALIARLELAGVSCKEFAEPLQQACADDCCSTVLQCLTAHISGYLLSDSQATLLHRSDHQRPYAQPSTADLDRLIRDVQREEDAKGILQASLSEEQLREAITEQEATLLQFEAKLRSLQALGSLITKQAPAAKPLQAAAAHHQAHAKIRHESARKRLQVQQVALNTLLQEINQTVAGLQAKYDPQHASWLLSLSNLQSLHQKDVAFQMEMDSLYKKQFQKGPAASMHEQHTSAQWLEGADPLQADSLHNILRGPDMQAYEEHVQELDRLRWIHEASQLQLITALAWQAKQEAILACAKASIEQPSALQEPSMMQAELDHLKAELKKLNQHKHHLLHDQLPALCTQVASLQDTQVLQQDYDAKLLRQSYTRTKKQGFIDLLIEQHARQQLLHLVRDAEVQRLQGTKQELQLLHEVLADVRSASQQRMTQYAQKELQPSTAPQLVVHDSDTFLHTLGKLIPEADEPSGGVSHPSKLYVTFQQLAEKLSRLDSDVTANAAIQLQVKQMQTGAVASRQAAFAKLHPVVFPDRDSTSPQLTAPELQEALQLAQAASTDLTGTVNQVAQQQLTYQNVLRQQHKQLTAERSVFHVFYNEPEKLKSTAAV